MVQNLAYKINENPLRGFTFIQVSDSFSRTCHHVGDNVEIVCMSVQFPTLSQKVAKTILKRSLQDCREIVNRGVDLKYYTFQLFEYRTNFPTKTNLARHTYIRIYRHVTITAENSCYNSQI